MAGSRSFLAVLLAISFMGGLLVADSSADAAVTPRNHVAPKSVKRTPATKRTASNKRTAPTKRTAVTKSAQAKNNKKAVHKSSKTRSARSKSISGRKISSTKKKHTKHKLAKKSAKHKVASSKHSHKKYAYPGDIFMEYAPAPNKTPLEAVRKRRIQSDFHTANATGHSPEDLARAKVFHHYPMRGGIFERREAVKFIVMHSTETERPADAPRVIRSWSNQGMRHAGAQYVVDRDGKIYQAVDPKYATVHVDIFRVKQGVNNDNSVGIEIVRSGKQKYTNQQLQSAVRLVSYLQSRYKIGDDRVLAHGEIQPSNRRDPVDFPWSKFTAAKRIMNTYAMASRLHNKVPKLPVTTAPLQAIIDLMPASLGMSGAGNSGASGKAG